MTDKELKLQLESIRSAQIVTSTYQQVAAMRMRKIKDTVIQNRAFYSSLSQVYNETRNFYIKFVQGHHNHQTIKTHRATNGKTVAILLSANTGLYGSVVRNTYDLFIKDQEKAGNDVVVVGKQGKNWFQASEYGTGAKVNVRYFELSDGADIMDSGVRNIFTYISHYSNILVYHGIFKSISQQPAQVTVVSEQIPTEKPNTETLSFIFEPSIGKVLQVFEEQLLYSFFDQTFYESSLAKYGSRMMSLDAVSQNTSKALTRLELSLVKMKHIKQNRKQIENLAGLLTRR